MNEPAETEPVTVTKPARASLPWSIAAGSLVALGFAVFAGVLPAKKEQQRLSQELARVQSELQATALATQEERTKIEGLLKSHDALSQEHTLTKERLEAAIAEKAEALAALEKARKDLSEALGTQIAAGDVLVKERNGELVVDVADQLLFETGKVEISEPGKKLLLEVAKSMRRLSPAQIYQVGGHTDSQRVVSSELVEQYPTNWELSANRATQVVRFLEDSGRVPGRQLIAAGFSQHRPASTNKTDSGRQKNRRIEIVLVRKRPNPS